MEEEKKYIAGCTIPLKFIVNQEGDPFPLDSIILSLSISEYNDLIPILTKTNTDFNIENNIATYVLTSDETKNLDGKYRYQISFTDQENNNWTEERYFTIRGKIQ